MYSLRVRSVHRPKLGVIVREYIAYSYHEGNNPLTPGYGGVEIMSNGAV